MIDVSALTIASARKALDSKVFSATDLAKAYLERIEDKNPELNAYVEVYDDVLEQAKKSDMLLQKGVSSSLAGIPIALKDNLLLKGKRASSSSKILENYNATYTATAVDRLKESGAFFLGRTNMDEFAMGSSTETSIFGVTKNPYDVTRVPGGSSGGSSAALGADLCLASLGSDTGGSIRQPAAFCGVVGFKPTYGAISRSGLMAMASSLDQIGPFGKTVQDTRMLFNVMRGQDDLDMTSISQSIWESNAPFSFNKNDLTIGVPWSFVERDGIDPDVLSHFKNTIKELESNGVKIITIDLPLMPLSLAAYYIIQPAETSSNMGRYDGIKYGFHKDGKNGIDDYFQTRGEGFGKEVRRRILLGTYVLSSGYYDSYYGKATAVREAIKKELSDTFKTVNAIAMPTTPSPAFKIGSKGKDPLAMYLEDIFTVSANIAGIPAISIPAGKVEREGVELPIGFQLLGPQFGDDRLLDIAEHVETVVAIK